MRGLPGKGGAGQRTPRIRLALLGWIAAGLALSVGVSLALATNALNVLGSPEVSAPTLQIDQDHQDAAQGGTQAGQEMSREQVIVLARHRYHAEVVRAHRVQGAQGRVFYDVRLLSPRGMVWTVRLDARSGAEVP
jgi:uncharacterized membrane protein YkoI